MRSSTFLYDLPCLEGFYTYGVGALQIGETGLRSNKRFQKSVGG